jgi:hypothetical protein
LSAQLKHVGDWVPSQHRRPPTGWSSVTLIVIVLVMEPQAPFATSVTVSVPL